MKTFVADARAKLCLVTMHTGTDKFRFQFSFPGCRVQCFRKEMPRYFHIGISTQSASAKHELDNTRNNNDRVSFRFNVVIRYRNKRKILFYRVSK